MAINPELITTIRVDQLADEALTFDSLFPHTVGTELKSSTIQELVDLVATAVGVSGGVGYLALSVTDGQQLPDVPTDPSFFLCGAGTFLNINGYPDVICTENLNAVMSLSDHWELAVEIPIAPLSGTVQTVTGSAVDNTDPLNPIINLGTGSSQTLSQTLDNGDITGGFDINISDGDAVILDNGSMLKKGTIDAGNGGAKGISQICAVGYEHKWEAGRLYIMNDGGTTIREVSHNFAVTPTVTDDNTKGFVVDTRWILDNGDIYVCTDATTGSAVWGLQSNKEILVFPTEADFPAVGQEGYIYISQEEMSANVFRVYIWSDYVTGYRVATTGLNDVIGVGQIVYNALDVEYNYISIGTNNPLILYDASTGDQVHLKRNVLGTGTTYPLIPASNDTFITKINGGVADENGEITISAGATNLSYTPSPTDGTVTSDTGTDATLPLADGTNAGLLKPAKYTVLENTSGTNTGDQDLSALAPLASPTFTGTVVLPSTTSIGTVSDTEIGYLDGVTSAIQTQLNARIKSIVSDAVASSTVSGVTAETLAKTYTISANTLASTDFMNVVIRAYQNVSTNAGTGFTVRLKINSTNNFATATTIATATTTSAFNPYSTMQRHFEIKSSLLQGVVATTSLFSDFIQNASARLSTAITTSADFYLYVSIQPTATTESYQISSVQITN